MKINQSMYGTIYGTKGRQYLSPLGGDMNA